MPAGYNRYMSRFGFVAICSLLCATLAAAQTPTEGRPAAKGPVSKSPAPALLSAPGSHVLDDTVALGQFLDGVMKTQVNDDHVASAVIAVVKDGRVLYARGYGNANIADHTPVDPATSMFRIGSISKLFTWTAVMQLVEQGKIDLNADVNTYLKGFQIPAAFGKPVTMKDLMTHSAGFEDGSLGYLITDDSLRVVPIAVAMRIHMPARVRPPGVLSAYSNYSAALAGLIVQQVSGIPYDEYIRRNILDPLDMHYATFHEPLPADLKADGVTAYTREAGIFAPKPFEYVGGFSPAGSGSMSAIAMTHFMIAHLQNGQYGTAHILQPQTVELMHSRAFANDPRLPGMDLGFYEQRMNGLHVIGHEGDTQYFHSAMFLIPDKNVGIFMSYAGSGAAAIRAGTLQAFFDRYYPAPLPTIPPAPANFAQTAQKYTGDYRFARHSYTKIDKVLTLLGAPIKVSVMPAKGRLLVTGLGAEPEQFAPVADSLFQQIEGDTRIGFTEDAAGNVTRLSIGALPFMGTERVPWYEVPSLWYAVLIISTLIFLSAFTSLYFRRREIRMMPTPQKRATWLSVAVAFWFFLTFIVLGVVVASAGATLSLAIPASLKAALVMPLILVLLTIFLIISAITVWRRGYWTGGRRVHFTLITIAAIAICLFFNQWNLLGWRFG